MQHRARFRGHQRNAFWRNRDRTLSRRVKEPLRLQPLLQRLQLLGEEAHPTRTEDGARDHLVATARRIEIDSPNKENYLPDNWRLFARSDAAAEANALKG